MSTPTFDEAALRRPEFTEGYKAALGDGREWTFPKAVLRIVPARLADGSFGVKETPPYGDDYQADLRVVLDNADDTPEGIYRYVVARMTLAAKLLLRNYDLTDDQLADLLYFDTGGGTNAMWAAIDRIIVGDAPKA
ncbi:hypothetical protein [Paludisphaera soli]|uniref:hypothetical protein n=1 Tax=Paludisphaera soli TaxID=2712865 RepID=UPI0013EBB302|nr:hypothetical protein [Paludisphaera soli]